MYVSNEETGGKYETINRPSGLIFDRKKHICAYKNIIYVVTETNQNDKRQPKVTRL
jgi:hypothetical protein